MSFVITESLVRKLVETVDAGLSQGVGEQTPGKMCVEAAISYALGERHSDGPSCVDPVVRLAKISLNDAEWSSNRARARGMRRVAIAQLGSKYMIDSVRFVALLSEYVIREVVPVALRWAAQVNPSHAALLEERAIQCEAEGTSYAARAASDAALAASDAARAASDAARAASYAARYAARAASDAALAASDAARAASYAARAASDAAIAASDAASDAALAASYAARDVESDRILSLCASLMVRALQECGSPGCAWLWLVDEIPTGCSNE